MEKISEIKKMILHLSDKEIMQLLCGNKGTGKVDIKKEDRGKWYDTHICALPKEGADNLKELENQVSLIQGASNVDKKLLRYLRVLRNMRLEVPDFFRDDIDPRVIYAKLNAFCKQYDIPEEIIQKIVPAVVTYIDTGHMRPIILVGDKGCGKTTALKLLLNEALRIPVEIVKVPQTDGGHGLTGDCGSYKSADAGILAKARINNDSLIVAYIFDEIDKVTHDRNRASIDDELLSITDSSRSDIFDDYLECRLVGLEYCPIFFTANNLNDINPILVDRCTVIKFPNASDSRIKSIARKYVEERLKSNLYKNIMFNYNLMDKSIEKMVAHDVTSLRKHEQLIENVLQSALNVLLVQKAGAVVEVTEDMFKTAENDIMGIEKKHIGFT